MTDTFPKGDKKDEKLSSPPKRSIRNIPLNKKNELSHDSTESNIHLPLKKEKSDYEPEVKREEKPIVEEAKHLVPEYREETPRSSFTPEDEDYERPMPKAQSVNSKADVSIENDIRSKEEAKAMSPIRVKRSSDSISKPKRSVIKREPAFVSNKDLEEENDENSSFEPLHSKHRGKKSKKLAIAFLLIVALGIGTLHTVFARATIVVTTPGEPYMLDNQLLPDQIPYQSFTKNGEKTVSVGTVKTVSVTKKATGNIIIYNNFSSKPYELIKTTRVETANGSVYRLLEDVTVPGFTGSTPGSVTAKVEADQAGDQYNAKGNLDLFFPGLVKGTDKYKKIYAKTAANFTGGMTGTAPDTSSADIQAAIADAKTSFESEALSEFITNNPNLVIVKDSVQTTSTVGAVKNSSVTVSLTTKAIALDGETLKRSIAGVYVEKKVMPSSEDLNTFTYDIQETPSKTLLEGNFTVAVSGGFRGQSSITPEVLKSNLSGKNIDAAKRIVGEEIPDSKIEITAWPFWKNTLPNNIDNIAVTIQQ